MYYEHWVCNAFFTIQLPNKPMDPSLMLPTKWLKQKHSIVNMFIIVIEDPSEDPSSVTVDMGMKN